MRPFVTRAIPLLLAAAISVPASPQIRTAPQPVMRNPNAPQRDVQQPPVTFTNLAFTIWTGDDDLRANSTVGADLHFPDGATTHCDLRPGNDSWDNNSVHKAAPCALLAPKALAELKVTKIDLVYWGDPHAAVSAKKTSPLEMNFDTYDNWNVTRVRVFAQNPAQHQQVCLLDVKDNPLVRMKETNPSFRLTDVMSSC